MENKNTADYVFIGCFAEKDRKGILGNIKEFVYEKAGWQIPTPPPDRKNALLSLKFYRNVRAESLSVDDWRYDSNYT